MLYTITIKDKEKTMFRLFFSSCTEAIDFVKNLGINDTVTISATGHSLIEINKGETIIRPIVGVPHITM